MKKYIFISILSCFTIVANAQIQNNITWSSINSGGSPLIASGNQKISQSIGQPIANTLSMTNVILTQGFQQGNVGWSLSNNDAKPAFAQVKVFPNPTSDVLQINLDENFLSSATYQWTILNIAGQIMQKGNISNTAQQIDVTGLSQGQYFLQLHVKDKTTNLNYVAKFLKIN